MPEVVVVAEERSEAATGGAAVARSGCAVCLAELALKLYDGCAAGRSLAPLVSGYTGLV